MPPQALMIYCGAPSTKSTHLSRFGAERVSRWNMAHSSGTGGASVIEGLRSLGGPVDELVDNDDVSGPNLLPQGTAGGGDDDVCAALLLQSPDVRPVVDF